MSAVDASYCVDADGTADNNSYNSGDNIQVWKADSSTADFKVEYLGDGYYRISEATTDLSVDLWSGDLTTYLNSQINIMLCEKNAGKNQKWIIKDMGDGYYSIISAQSGYCLDLYGGECENGKNICQVNYLGSDAQKWKFVSPAGVPQKSELKVSKSSVLVGEGVTFTASSDTATTYTIGIDKGNSRYITDTMPNGKLTFYFESPGTYSAYVTASNAKGYCDSKRITVTVKNTLTLHNADKYSLPYKERELTYNSNNTDVAVVTSAGVVTAVGEGNAILTMVKKDGATFQIHLEVKKAILFGDCTKDGVINVLDVVMLQKWLLKQSNTMEESDTATTEDSNKATMNDSDAADMNNDGVIDVFDLGLLKRKLLAG